MMIDTTDKKKAGAAATGAQESKSMTNPKNSGGVTFTGNQPMPSSQPKTLVRTTTALDKTGPVTVPKSPVAGGKDGKDAAGAKKPVAAP